MNSSQNVLCSDRFLEKDPLWFASLKPLLTHFVLVITRKVRVIA